jgi:hypothetical protein
LCFGTTNIYADLSLGVLYFGEDWWDQIFGSGAPGDGNLFKWRVWSGLQNRLLNQEFKDNVKANLQQTTHLASLSNYWSRFGILHRSGAALRADAKAVFQKLTQLSLVTRQEHDSYDAPGSVEFMNDMTQSWGNEFQQQFLTLASNDEIKKEWGKHARIPRFCCTARSKNILK